MVDAYGQPLLWMRFSLGPPDDVAIPRLIRKEPVVLCSAFSRSSCAGPLEARSVCFKNRIRLDQELVPIRVVFLRKKPGRRNQGSGSLASCCLGMMRITTDVVVERHSHPSCGTPCCLGSSDYPLVVIDRTLENHTDPQL
jgi:hypothetical protein